MKQEIKDEIEKLGKHAKLEIFTSGDYLSLEDEKNHTHICINKSACKKESYKVEIGWGDLGYVSIEEAIGFKDSLVRLITIAKSIRKILIKHKQDGK